MNFFLTFINPFNWISAAYKLVIVAVFALAGVAIYKNVPLVKQTVEPVLAESKARLKVASSPLFQKKTTLFDRAESLNNFFKKKSVGAIYSVFAKILDKILGRIADAIIICVFGVIAVYFISK